MKSWWITNIVCIEFISDALGMASHPAIPVQDLARHVDRLKENDHQKFSQEYESIEPGQQFTWEASNLEVNKSKNRYANVIAYDHSRICLQPLDGIPGSDYINANFIDGQRENSYIATQVSCWWQGLGNYPLQRFSDDWHVLKLTGKPKNSVCWTALRKIIKCSPSSLCQNLQMLLCLANLRRNNDLRLLFKMADHCMIIQVLYELMITRNYRSLI